MAKILKSITGFFEKTAGTVRRYPLTVALLLAATVCIWIQIFTESDDLLLSKLILSLVVGGFVGIAAQSVSENLKKTGLLVRLVGMIFTVAVAAIFFAVLFPLPKFTSEISVRAAVSIFAAVTLFIWFAPYRIKADFNHHFLSHFKSLFTTLLYCGVISGGISLILFSINSLLVRVDPKTYSVVLSALWTFFAPIVYLSLLPDPEPEEEKEGESVPVSLPAKSQTKFLHILISYIIVPLFSVFSLILSIYAVKTAVSFQWATSILEPLVLACSIIGIIVYLLASNFSDAIARIFRMIFPKLLIFLTVFELLSIYFTFTSLGLDEGRYYVILFSVFVLISSVLFCFVPLRKNGIVAPIAVFLALLSVLPPVDAFTLSRGYQISQIEAVLIRNNMLKNGVITQNSAISAEDKNKISKSVGYLIDRGYTSYAPFLPGGFDTYEEFEPIFGFSPYDYEVNEPSLYINFFSRKNVTVSVKNYDVMLTSNVFDGTASAAATFQVDGVDYQFSVVDQKTSGLFRIERKDNSAKTEIEFYSKLLPLANNQGKNTDPTGADPLILETTGAAGKMKVIIYEFYSSVENGTTIKNLNMNAQVYFSAFR